MSSIQLLRRKIYSFAERFRRNYDSLLARELEFVHLPPAHAVADPLASERPRTEPLRILYLVRRYERGHPRFGFGSSEYFFFNSLVNMGHTLLRLNFETSSRRPYEAVNQMLLDAVHLYHPDVLFTIPRDELSKDVIRKISTETNTLTLAWFVDDDWRFEDHTRHWAPLFNWVVTNAKSALPKYSSIGYRNVMHQYFACNHFLYRQIHMPYRYDVSFVGAAHGNRAEVVADLRKRGIDVHTWGAGWPGGRLSVLEMINVFNQTKVNLNLSAASVGGVNEVKGRDFEIPGCGAFMITGAPKDEIAHCYQIGQEIEHYDTTAELADKIRHYLAHDEQRQTIAERAYRRTLRDHTYVNRFHDIFTTMGIAEGEW